VRLVDDLLDVSRVATGKIELQSRPIDLHDVLARCVEMTTPLIQERGHSLQIALPQRPLPLVADPARLAQVFANLLINAAKYTERGGHIQVAGAMSAEDVEVAIIDDGIGIAPELLPRLFDLFVQGGQELDRAKGGLGLGLSIVRSLTSLHGGIVAAHSEGPGRGSRFTVRLPLAAAGDATPHEGAAQPLASAGGPRVQRILVVDDNQDAAELLVEFLRRSGHETCLAHDGPSAVSCAAEFAPDIVLLDLGLPVLDGYEVARRLRQQLGGERLGLIAITGYGQENDRRRAREASFNAHLVKPVSMQQLATAIAELEQRVAPCLAR
jgi:CheY-like chemotaxis protein